MENTLEFDILLKNMKYDQLMYEAIKNNEFKRAIDISRRRHLRIKKLIKKSQNNESSIPKVNIT